MAAINALANFPRREAAEAIVAVFPGNEHFSRPALEKLGAVAEEPIWPLLGHSQWHVQYQACLVLQKIGTARSLPLLRETAGKTTLLAKKGAEDAIKAIEARQ
jgi:hypothetical protein